MKIKKIIKFIIISLGALIIISALGMMVWSKIGTYPAREVALSALESSEEVTITNDKYIAFTPAEKTETGLIFYPGGLVEPSAYAPILREIAENGVLVIITPMPLNLAIFNTSAANAVTDAYPQITNWTLAGHSLGGAAAGLYAEKNSDRIDAIVFWDSYPPDSADLSDNSIRAVSIFGTTDSFPNTENFDDKRYLLPENTLFVGLEGANHAQFGDYGPQKGDVIASIGLSEQHELVANIMLDFIFQN